MNVVGQGISELIKVNDLSSTERGSDGFGSTGKE
jgi:dUTPase